MRSQSTAVKMLISIVVFFIVGYGLFSIRFFILGPNLEITNPTQNSITTKNNSYIISGHAERINHISINDQPINIDENGNFSYTLPLSAGHSIITVYAKDKFDREIKRDLWINYTGEDPQLPFFRAASNQNNDNSSALLENQKNNIQLEEVAL